MDMKLLITLIRAILMALCQTLKMLGMTVNKAEVMFSLRIY